MSLVIIQESRLFQDTCQQWTDCQSCVADTGCGYCASLGRCIPGNWFGALNQTLSICPVKEYYYKQCQLSSLPLGIMASFVLLVLLILVLIGLCYICCCCTCCCPDPDDEEREELLGHRSQYLRRSSTYYQWNRPPPPTTAQFKHQPHPSRPSSFDPAPSSPPPPPEPWESRRSQLLKKYARDPPH